MKLISLINLKAKSMKIAKKVVPLMAKICVDEIPLGKRDSFGHLVLRLYELIDDDKTFLDKITLDELIQNNYEFLDTLRSSIFFLLSYPNTFDKEYLRQLQTEIDPLIKKLNSPPFLQHRERTPEDATEPLSVRFK